MLALICLLPLATGCIIIPVPANRFDLTVRTNVTPQLVYELGPAKPSRTEVLLRLGEPDEASLDERKFRFHSDRIKWDIYWAVAGSYSAQGGDIEIHRFYDLVVLFDEAGNLGEAAWLEGSSPKALREKASWPPAPTQ